MACAREDLAKLGGPEKLFLLAGAGLDVALEGKARDRDRVAPLLVALAGEKVLAASHIADAFLPLLELLADLAIDAPKAPEWLGDILKALVAAGAADLGFLEATPAGVTEMGEEAVEAFAAFKAYVAK